MKYAILSIVILFQCTNDTGGDGDPERIMRRPTGISECRDCCIEWDCLCENYIHDWDEEDEEEVWILTDRMHYHFESSTKTCAEDEADIRWDRDNYVCNNCESWCYCHEEGWYD